jgi:hypothetical protein
MTLLRRLFAGALLGFVAFAAYAADIGGTWNLTVETSAGTGNPTLVLVQNGENLTGTYTGRFGESPVKGTFKDGAIAFSITVKGPMGEAEINYVGKVDGNAMSGTAQGPMGAATFTGKKNP